MVRNDDQVVIALFQGLSPIEKDSVTQLSIRRKFPRSRHIFEQGQSSSSFYALLQGQVKIVQVTSEGREVVLRLVGPGQMFGCVSALGDPEYPGTAIAMEDCIALGWDTDTSRKLMGKYPRFAMNVLQSLGSRLRESEDRYRELATEHVDRRIAHALLRLSRQAPKKAFRGARLELDLTREDLAQLSGTTLFSVSRQLSEWSRKGWVESKRKHIVIKDLRPLLQAAGEA